MGSIRALKAVRGDGVIRRCAVSLDDFSSMTSEVLRGSTSVFVFAQGELDRLAAQGNGIIRDRGRKSGPKPLAYYFQRRSGLVRLRAGYTVPGQTERGIRTLLASREIPSHGAAYLVGVAADLFEQLWQRQAADSSTSALRESREVFAGKDEFSELLEENPRLKVPAELRQRFVGDSPAAEAVRKRVLLAAGVNFPVLIEGETGTGKEVIAHAIHDFGSRKTERFMSFNCGGVPRELLESELFGHEKGAFTGAVRHKEGLWTLADNGTLFLDEVGDLSLQHQVKILRALENGTYRTVGGVQEITGSARIIAATNCNLRRMVESGTFREDLYYRLFNLRIRAPALREHPTDIPPMAAHFWNKLVGESTPVLSAEILRQLTACPWPGNARELRAFLANLAALADGREASLAMVQAIMRDRMGPMFSAGGHR